MEEKTKKISCAVAIAICASTLLNKDYLVEKHADLPSESVPIAISVPNFLASSISGSATIVANITKEIMDNACF